MGMCVKCLEFLDKGIIENLRLYYGYFIFIFNIIILL